MKNILFCILVVMTLTISCRGRHINTPRILNHEFLDTIIYVDSIGFLVDGEKDDLAYTDAQKALKDYFNKIGYYNHKDSAAVDWDNDIILCADVDTVRPIHLNKDKFIDAIIEYQDAPCLGSSTCYLPHKAIVAYINGKYRLIARDFIPSRYFIDSIRFEKGFQIIYGEDYNCGEHEIVRRFRAQVTPIN